MRARQVLVVIGIAVLAAVALSVAQPQITPGPPMRRGGTSGFDTVCLDAANIDACFSRGAANRIDVNTGDDLSVTAARITAGSGTGVTVNSVGTLRQQIYKVTVASTQFISAALTHDVTVATLPAKTLLLWAMADLTTTFACTAVCTTATLSMTLGSAAGGTQYLLSFDADAAIGQFGDAQGELGAAIASATAETPAGDLPSFSGTNIVSLRLTSGTGNVGDGSATNLSQGSVTLYLATMALP